ncbi:hypothetical protein [Flavobacterium orientale]|nr:hypothetical protein [Flavobacterium orientale]
MILLRQKPMNTDKPKTGQLQRYFNDTPTIGSLSNPNDSNPKI